MPKDEAGFSGYYLQSRVLGIVARWMGPVLLVAFALMVAGIMGPPPWVVWAVLVAFPVFLMLRKRFTNTVEQQLYSWRIGRDSEWEVRDALANHLGDSFYLLNDLVLPGSGGNIDHVVVGPSGIHVIETKGIVGHVDASGDRLRLNGFVNRKHTATLNYRRQAVRKYLEGVLPGDQRRYPIYGVLVFTRASEVKSWGTTDDVCVESVSGMLRLLDKFAGHRRVDELSRAQIFHALAPHVASARKRAIPMVGR